MICDVVRTKENCASDCYNFVFFIGDFEKFCGIFAVFERFPRVSFTSRSLPFHIPFLLFASFIILEQTGAIQVWINKILVSNLFLLIPFGHRTNQRIFWNKDCAITVIVNCNLGANCRKTIEFNWNSWLSIWSTIKVPSCTNTSIFDSISSWDNIDRKNDILARFNLTFAFLDVDNHSLGFNNIIANKDFAK